MHTLPPLDNSRRVDEAIERGPCGLAWIALIFTAVLLLAAHAEADAARESNDRPRVFLVVKDAPDPLVRRLAAELGSLGFDVAEIDDDQATASQLEVMAKRAAALAVVRVMPGNDSVELWIVDLRTHAMIFRRVVSGRDPAILALRSAEALRASLVDLSALVPMPAKPPAVETALAPRPSPAPSSSAREVGVELALGATFPAGNLGSSLQAFAAIDWMPSAHFGFQLVGVLPLTAQRVTADEGSASVMFGLMGAGITFSPLSTSAWSPYMAAGIGAALLHTHGSPAPGFLGHSRLDFTAMPYLRAGVGYSFTARLRVKFDLLGALSLPEPAVLFVDSTTATWGRPLTLGILGVELVWR